MKHLYDMKYLLRKYEVNAEKNKCADKACFMRKDRYSFLNALKARLIKKVLPYSGKNFFWLGWRDSDPRDAGVKVLCLTAWRHPNMKL